MENPILLQDLGMMCISSTSKNKRRFGIYKCTCGNEFKARTDHIKNNHTNSCGCYQKNKAKQANTIHGMSKTNFYKLWTGMIQRCTNINNKNYKFYGERGIKVCDKWLDFENFYNDMFQDYKYYLTIDRINPNGNYEKENCRWTTRVVQSRNTRLLRITNKSGYRGVSFRKDTKKWVAKVCVSYEKITIGYFATAKEAGKAYNNYILQHNLENTLNIID